MRLKFPDAAAKKILAEVAKETGLLPHVVEEIVKSQFKFVEDSIRHTDGKDIFLSKFGRWRIKIHKMSDQKNIDKILEKNLNVRPDMDRVLEKLKQEYYESRSGSTLRHDTGSDDIRRGGERDSSSGGGEGETGDQSIIDSRVGFSVLSQDRQKDEQHVQSDS